MQYRVGIDIGGTFTDFALQRPDGIVLHKNLSTPRDRSLGVMQGLERLAALEGLALGEFLARCQTIVHGTTVADNTLIEMNGALTGLITTEGFRDELEYRRGFKEDVWDLRLPPARPLVPRRRRLTVRERVLFDGSVHIPLDEASVRECCRRLALQGVESVAISLLFSFVSPEHERRVAAIVADELPGVAVSVSHQVLPRAPEFDRTSTTVVNAYVAPRVTQYMERLADRLSEAGYRRRLMVMQASGGVMTREYIAGAPVRVLASGPAGGVVGSAHAGLAKGCRDLLCVDMGGTSYDVSLVLDGVAPAESGWNMHHRCLVGVPMVKVETLGAGGGSICHRHNGVLEVGPASAGSEPGPVCYGRGGTQATVTDALLVLGILSASAEFAGGSFTLCERGVREAFAALSTDAGRSPEDIAFDCWRIVNANMTQAVRRTTAGRGIDPRDLVMLAYGGNGPAFAGVQAEELGIDRVLVPRASPTFSALGTLVAKPGIDEERSCICAANAPDLARLRALWTELAGRAAQHFADAGFAPADVSTRYLMNMRYRGQNFSLSFLLHEHKGPGQPDFVDAGLAERAMQLFDRRHTEEYGHVREGEIPEIVGVRMESFVEVPAPLVGSGFTATRREAATTATRRANLGQGYRQTAVFRGSQLEPGHVVRGPAIIEESFTTIVVYPDWIALVDDAGDYELRREASA